MNIPGEQSSFHSGMAVFTDEEVFTV